MWGGAVTHHWTTRKYVGEAFYAVPPQIQLLSLYYVVEEEHEGP
jgi:hypothetical protein